MAASAFQAQRAVAGTRGGIGQILRRGARGKRQKEYRATNASDGNNHILHVNKSPRGDKSCFGKSRWTVQNDVCKGDGILGNGKTIVWTTMGVNARCGKVSAILASSGE